MHNTISLRNIFLCMNQLYANMKHSKAIRVMSKCHIPFNLLPPSILDDILKEVKITLQKINASYDSVIKSHHL